MKDRWFQVIPAYFGSPCAVAFARTSVVTAKVLDDMYSYAIGVEC